MLYEVITSIVQQHCASFLLTENLNDLHLLVRENQQSSRIQIPLPGKEELEKALVVLSRQYPKSLSSFSEHLEAPAAALCGSTLQSIETHLQLLEHRSQTLQPASYNFV